MTLTNLTGAELKLLSTFAGSDPGRPTLTRVAVYEDGALAASNGLMGVMRIPADSGCAAPTAARSLVSTIPIDSVALCCKVAGSQKCVDVSKDGALVAPGLAPLPFDTPSDSDYPNLWKVFPGEGRKTKLPDGFIGCDARLMGRFMTAIGRIDPTKGMRHIALHMGDPLEPMLARWTTQSAQWHAVVMPSRI